MVEKKYYFGDLKNCKELADILVRECGATLSNISDAGFTIDSWNSIQGKSFQNSFSTSSNTPPYKYFIRNIEGKELIWVTNATNYSGASCNFLYIDDNRECIVSYTSYASGFGHSVILPIPQATYIVSQNVNLAKASKIAKSNNSGDVLLSVKTQGIYISDSLLSLGSIYTDGNGKSFIACNPFMAVEYENK